MKKLIYILVYIFINVNIYSYLQIYPTIFDKNIDKNGGSEVYELSNPTLSKVRYIFYIDKISDEKDMSQWIEYYPKTMTLNPGEKRKLTVFVKAPEKLKKGEYTAILGIKELPIVTEKDIIEKNRSLNILTNLKMEIAGFVGDLPLELDGKNIELDQNKRKINGKVKNNGEKRATFTFYLVNTASKQEYYLGAGRILPKKEFDLSTLPEIKKNENLKNYNEVVIKDKNRVVKRLKI
ncbi:MAG: hypothetical protein ACRC8M_08635 [Cetobacterium sp.]|uniref:hypothetical protein n=1 Tax=Cetobacterium sp. TaxID=2071632 RepID=UPI003F33BC43